MVTDKTLIAGTKSNSIAYRMNTKTILPTAEFLVWRTTILLFIFKSSTFSQGTLWFIIHLNEGNWAFPGSTLVEEVDSSPTVNRLLSEPIKSNKDPKVLNGPLLRKNRKLEQFPVLRIFGRLVLLMWHKTVASHKSLLRLGFQYFCPSLGQPFYILKLSSLRLKKKLPS